MPRSSCALVCLLVAVAVAVYCCVPVSAAPAAPTSPVILNRCTAPKYVSPADADTYLICASGVMRYTASTDTLVQVATLAQCPAPTAVLYDAATSTVLAACSTSGLLAFRQQQGGTYTMTSLVTGTVTYLAHEPTLNQYYFTASAGANNVAVGSIAVQTAAVTKLADRTQCVDAYQVHASPDGVVVASCMTNGNSTPYPPTAIKMFNGTVINLVDASVCKNPKGIVRTPLGKVYVGCYSYSNRLFDPATVVVQEQTLVTSFPLTKGQCDQAYSFAYDAETGFVYAACSPSSDGLLWSIASSGAVTKLLTLSQCGSANQVLALSSGAQLVACEGAAVLKVTSAKVEGFILNDCPSPVDVSFSRPTGDQSGTGSLDALCSNYQVVTVANGVKNVSTFATTCLPRQVRRDRLNPERLLVSCSTGGSDGLAIAITGSTINRFGISATFTDSPCSSALQQTADGSIYIACFQKVYTASNFTNARLFTDGTNSCPNSFNNLALDANGALIAQCGYQANKYQLVQFDSSATGAVKVGLPYSLPPAGLCSGNVVSPTVDAVTGTFVGGCQSASQIVAFDFAAQTATILANAGCEFSHIIAHANTFYFTCATGVWAVQAASIAPPRAQPLQLLSSSDCAAVSLAHRLAFDAVTRSLFVACAGGILKVNVSTLVYPTEPLAPSSTAPNGGKPNVRSSSTGAMVPSTSGSTGAPSSALTPTATIVALVFSMTLEDASPVEFQLSFAMQMCYALGLPSSRCTIVSVAAGSVIIRTRIDPPSAGDPSGTSITVDAAVKSLQSQFVNPTSTLRQLPTFKTLDTSRAIRTETVKQCADGSFDQPCKEDCTPGLTCAAPHVADAISFLAMMTVAGAVALATAILA